MLTKVIKINKDIPEVEKVKQAVDVLSKGGLVAFPTETVYGLGASTKDKKAMQRLFEVKKRPKDKSFSLLVPNVYAIDNFAIDVLPFAYRLADKFWPGPLTLVLKSKDSSTVGLRMPKTPVVLEIIHSFDFPIACPSANLSGKRSPLNAQDVLEDLKGKIELVLDGGKVELGAPSTVVDATDLPVKILRKGFIDDKSIQDVAARKRIIFVCTGNSCRSVMAKGLFEKKLKEKGRSDIEVSSAGIAAPMGLKASPETQQLLMEEGIDVSNHHAQRATGDMLKRCDLIFVMQRFQEETMLKNYSFLKGRVYLLKEFSKFDHNELDIEDPMGKGMEVYKKSFYAIKEAIGRLVDLV
jgi:tRNA threonylcarbamoyl adenosine modification protein (Sua5/YciO/YrdC/YwlC family)